MADSLVYLLGLADSPDHEITSHEPAKSILSYLFDTEEQVSSGKDLLSSQKNFCSRYFAGGYFPQTPCMLTKLWSPIGAMLTRNMEPVVLNRSDRKVYAVATGIWEPCNIDLAEPLENCKTVASLFWAILNEASRRARERKMWVSVIACPGWSYDTKIDSLPRLSAGQVAEADRILWRRTPDDAC